MKKIFNLTIAAQAVLAFMAIAFCSVNSSFALQKTASLSGNWGSGGTWSNSNLPTSTDTVVIPYGVIITMNCNGTAKTITINPGGVLNLMSSYTLSLYGALTVNGTMDMNDGNITQNTNGAAFVIGANGSFEWEPGNNTSGGASLFAKGIENFSSSSTLKIKRWYDYLNTPLGMYVTGNFGNLTLNSSTNGIIYEWNQNNQFQAHQILGTLTIDQGWITLDRSSAITNTTIGNIVLLSVNSSLYLHRLTHNSSFTVNTTSITNTGGTLIGIHNGNGNVTINVSGNVTTTGNIKVINNDGVLNVGLGNAALNVGGTYTQTAGDTRILYNISVMNSGAYTFTANTVQFNGGIFMGQYGCHQNNGTATVSITNNLNLNFSASSDIFRFNGLTSLSGNMNNLKLVFTVGGNLTITSNNNGAEFTSAAASGWEDITINGNMSVSGGKVSFNNGFPTAAHDVVFNLVGNMTISGGVFNLSKHLGTGTYNINGNFNMTSGTFAVKGDDGVCTVNFNGAYTQSGGLFYIHYNNSKVSTAPSTVIVNGVFTHSGGTFNFDDNASNITETHELVIKGPSYNLTGNGLITHAGAGTCTVFGLIRFSRNGTITFNRSASGHSITQVKQLINGGTTLDVFTGNVQLASHNTAALDFLTIQGDATLKLRAGQICSNGTYTYSGFNTEKDAVISTMNLFGFYDGTAFAAVKSTGNMNFFLDESSTVEYNGWSNQIITGTGVGVATTDDHKYGILKINFNGVDDWNYLYPTSSNIYVRTQLVLLKGELKLNGFPVTIVNGATSSITRTNGYVKSESTSANSNSNLVWQNMSSGAHIFPFGKSSLVYLPVTFSPSIGMGGTVTIGTRATAMNNLPRPLDTLINVLAEVPLASTDLMYADNNMIDRWWDIEAPGFTATLTLSYPAEENTISPQFRTGLFNFEEYHNGVWLTHEVTGNGVTSGIGTFTMDNASTFSSWTIVARSPAPLPVSLVDFSAKPATNAVILSWVTSMEVNNDYFTLEKSSDGNSFTLFAKVDGAGNCMSMKTYKHTDNDVEEGIIYYRLSQTDFDGTTVKHKVVSVNLGNVYFTNDISVERVYPSPFSESFTVLFNSSRSIPVDVTLTDMNGRVIRSESINGEKGSNTFKYENSENIPKGIYFINITASGKTITRKIIKS